MKKLVSLILAVMMACMMLPALAEATDVVGDWYLTEVQMGEDTLPPSALGMEMTITLNEGGTALIVTSYGEEAEEEADTWTMTDGALTLTAAEGEAQEFLLEDDLLKYDIGGAYLIFSREVPEAAVLPKVRAESGETPLWFLGPLGTEARWSGPQCRAGVI